MTTHLKKRILCISIFFWIKILFRHKTSKLNTFFHQIVQVNWQKLRLPKLNFLLINSVSLVFLLPFNLFSHAFVWIETIAFVQFIFSYIWWILFCRSNEIIYLLACHSKLECNACLESCMHPSYLMVDDWLVIYLLSHPNGSININCQHIEKLYFIFMKIETIFHLEQMHENKEIGKELEQFFNCFLTSSTFSLKIKVWNSSKKGKKINKEGKIKTKSSTGLRVSTRFKIVFSFSLIAQLK